jgi:hypothetical protein
MNMIRTNSIMNTVFYLFINDTTKDGMRGSRASPNTVELALPSLPDGTWIIAFGDGLVSVLNPTGRFLGDFDTTSGFPAAKR